MIREKSCGAVVYSEFDGERKYLIVQMKKGHFSMAKGHVEPGETEKETAEREIREETGLSVDVDTGYRHSVLYKPYAGCIKEVVFFIAQADSTETVPQEAEIKSILWLSFEDALKRLTYDNDRTVLRGAQSYLAKKI